MWFHTWLLHIFTDVGGDISKSKVESFVKQKDSVLLLWDLSWSVLFCRLDKRRGVKMDDKCQFSRDQKWVELIWSIWRSILYADDTCARREIKVSLFVHCVLSTWSCKLMKNVTKDKWQNVSCGLFSVYHTVMLCNKKIFLQLNEIDMKKVNAWLWAKSKQREICAWDIISQKIKHYGPFITYRQVNGIVKNQS